MLTILNFVCCKIFLSLDSSAIEIKTQIEKTLNDIDFQVSNIQKDPEKYLLTEDFNQNPEQQKEDFNFFPNMFLTFKKLGVLSKKYFSTKKNTNLRKLVLQNLSIHNKQFTKNQDYYLNNNGSILTAIYMFLCEIINQIYFFRLISYYITQPDLKMAKEIFIKSTIEIIERFKNKTFVYKQINNNINSFKQELFLSIVELNDKDLLTFVKYSFFSYGHNIMKLQKMIQIYKMCLNLDFNNEYSAANLKDIFIILEQILSLPQTDGPTTKKICLAFADYLQNFGYGYRSYAFYKNTKNHRNQTFDFYIENINSLIKNNINKKKHHLDVIISILETQFQIYINFLKTKHSKNFNTILIMNNFNLLIVKLQDTLNALTIPQKNMIHNIIKYHPK